MTHHGGMRNSLQGRNVVIINKHAFDLVVEELRVVAFLA